MVRLLLLLSFPGQLVLTHTTVPLTIVPIALIMVNQHPVPVDDCPCFEDAIAFVSVLMGSLLGRWYAVQNGFDQTFFSTSMPGSDGSGWVDRSMWWGVASLKMVFGVSLILPTYSVHEYGFNISL